MTTSNKQIVLEVLKRAFIERDPTVVEQCFAANYKQHNPIIPDGPSAIAKMIPTLTGLTYEPGMAVADGDLVMVHGAIPAGDQSRWLQSIFSVSRTAK